MDGKEALVDDMDGEGECAIRVDADDEIEFDVKEASIEGVAEWPWCVSVFIAGCMAGAETFACIGRPISVPAALLVLRVLPVVACVARLNMCGIRARLKELELCPSGGWNCWKDSNSERRALRLRKSSWTGEAPPVEDVWEGWTSRMAGMESPSRR